MHFMKHLITNLTLYKIFQLFYGEAFNKRNTIPQRFMRIVTRTPFKNIFYKINIYFNNNKLLNTIDSDIFEEKFDDENSINSLKSQGIFYKFKIKSKIIENINNKIKFKKFFVNRIEKKITINERTKETYVMRYHNPHLEINEIKQIMFNKQIVNLVKRYLGTNPIVQSTQIWWTFPYYNDFKKLDNPPGNEFGYHYDVDDYKFLKFFIYLTDVDLETGPHVYINNSGNKTFKEYLNRRLSDAEAEKNYSKRIKILTGKSGNGFIEDASFFHKGTNPRKSTGRCLLQIVYSINKW